MKNITDFLALAFYLAIVFVLVRPGSQGPKFVTSVGNGLSGLVTAGTGGGTWASA